MAKDIYFNDKKNLTEYANQNSSWNSDVFKEKLTENGISFPEQPKKKSTVNYQPASPAPKKKKKKKHTAAKRILCILLIIVLLFTSVTFAGVGILLKDYSPSELNSNSYISQSMLKDSEAVFNILLLGVDNIDKDSDSRSDSMILLSIDSLHNKIKLTSFMRDMYVNVPGYGSTKLTHACQYGGAQLTVDTIEADFGIDIDAYAKIGYQFLIDLVDGLGGITVSEIDETEAKAMKREWVTVEPGTDIELDGKGAIAYCRIRKGQSDFQRTERQREMITLIVKKALKTNPVKLVKIAQSIISEAECSVSKSEIPSLVLKVLPCLMGEIEQQQIPADGEWWNDTVSGMAVLQIDLDANKEILKEFIYG